MKEKTLYIIGGTLGGLVLTYFGYSLWRANKNKELAERGERLETGSTTGTTDDNTQSSDARKESRDSFPMGVSVNEGNTGSYGYKVSLLQSALNKLGASLTVDGRFGAKTYDAITEHGELGWYALKWGFTCGLAYGCTLIEEYYNDILEEATKQGWKKEQAQGVASETWKEFVENGDDWVYNNLRM